MVDGKMKLLYSSSICFRRMDDHVRKLIQLTGLGAGQGDDFQVQKSCHPGGLQHIGGIAGRTECQKHVSLFAVPINRIWA